jgi:hypothetical protein
MPCLNGKAKVKINKCKYIETQAGDPAFIVAFSIVENIVVPDGKDEDGRSWPKIGEDRDWFCSLKRIKGGGQPGAGDMKAFCTEADENVAALLEQIEHGDISQSKKEELSKQVEELFDFIVGDDNPLEGLEMIVTTTAARTKSKSPFTRHAWVLA